MPAFAALCCTQRARKGQRQDCPAPQTTSFRTWVAGSIQGRLRGSRDPCVPNEPDLTSPAPERARHSIAVQPRRLPEARRRSPRIHDRRLRARERDERPALAEATRRSRIETRSLTTSRVNVVADASPLRYLIVIDHAHVLPAVSGRMIKPAVRPASHCDARGTTGPRYLSSHASDSRMKSLRGRA